MECMQLHVLRYKYLWHWNQLIFCLTVRWLLVQQFWDTSHLGFRAPTPPTSTFWGMSQRKLKNPEETHSGIGRSGPPCHTLLEIVLCITIIKLPAIIGNVEIIFHNNIFMLGTHCCAVVSIAISSPGPHVMSTWVSLVSPISFHLSNIHVKLHVKLQANSYK